MGDGIEPLANQIMTVLLTLIQTVKTSTVQEDAFLVVGTMASALEVKFSPYIQAFLPLLYPALKAHEDTQLCTVAIGVIGDISRALGEQSTQYAGPFMQVLLESLQSETLNRNVKIPILSCFGDIALAIGPNFEPYLDTSMGVLRQAGMVVPSPVSNLFPTPILVGLIYLCRWTTSLLITCPNSGKVFLKLTLVSLRD